jgi:hypothetical protein
MTIDLYALNNAVNQGNMRTAAVEEHNRDVTVYNNELAGRIDEAKRSATEGLAEIGAADSIKTAIASSGAISSAQAYLKSKAGQVENAVTTARNAVEDVKNQVNTARDAVTNVSSDIPKPPSGEAPPASSEGGIINRAMGAAGIGADTAAKLTKGIGLVGDAYTIGSDIEKDLNGQFQKMDWEQKVGNIGGIAGSALDIVGTAIPSLGILKVVGTGISALTGVIGGIGDERAELTSGQQEVSQLQNQKQNLQQVVSNAGKTPILAQ